MVAAFVVENGTGLAAANSYLSEADADQYHEDYGNPAAWTALTSAQKTEHLVKATRYLDGTYQDRWKGTRNSRAQGLDWPRNFVQIDGFHLPTTPLPPSLADATAIMALSSAGEDVFPDVTNPGTLTAKSEKVGPIARSQTFYSQSQVKAYRLAAATIGPLLEPLGIQRG